jgi:hypothetical protein
MKLKSTANAARNGDSTQDQQADDGHGQGRNKKQALMQAQHPRYSSLSPARPAVSIGAVRYLPVAPPPCYL